MTSSKSNNDQKPIARKIAISINSAWNIANFRSSLIREFIKQGHDVIAIAPPDENVTKLEALGCRFIPLEIDNKGTSPLNDAKLFMQYRKILYREKPSVFLGYTIKPNVYGSLAAHSLGVPVINNVSGLGTAFIKKTFLTRLVTLLYKMAFLKSKMIFFQNKDDLALFLEKEIVNSGTTGLLPGSGIDLKKFAPSPLTQNQNDKTIRFLLIARLLYDKGVGEFVEAARILKNKVPELQFFLMGFLDSDNRTAVSRADVEKWVSEGIIDYIPASDDVRDEITQADCIVLPSYREGTPRTLLEGAAMGRPLVATDVPGCRETLDDGVTGYLCEVRNATDLADKMLKFSELSIAERQAMADAGREKMERQFDEKIVIKIYMEELKKIFEKA